jgi:15-cis-phytoene synthase
MLGKRSLKELGYRQVNLDLAEKFGCFANMDQPDDDLLPPERLAIAYAPVAVRTAFSLLLRFDNRFAHIAGQPGEPLIKQMKLAWWRDAVAADPDTRPKGERLLGLLSQTDIPDVPKLASTLVNAWEMLVVDEVWSSNGLEEFAKQRAKVIFGGYASMAGIDAAIDDIGADWALDDLQRRFGNRVSTHSVATSALPTERKLRPLTILALSVRDVSGPRLIWHALTGR